MMRMKRYVLITCWVILGFTLHAQTALKSSLQSAWSKFSDDPQLNYGIAGICVLDASTGLSIFEKNSRIGLAPASTQKVITAIAAYESLGADFHYTTRIGYTGRISGGVLEGDLVVEGSGDPTLGSYRYASSKPELFLKAIQQALEKAGIKSITGNVVGTDKGFDINPTPEGWIWGDMGNYYGAGLWAINWNENQYDVLMNTGKTENAATSISKLDPEVFDESQFVNDVKSGKPGTGDRSILYNTPYSKQVIYQGKLEPSKTNFKISGATPDASLLALQTITSWLVQNGIDIKGKAITHFMQVQQNESAPTPTAYLLDYQSPGIDSLMYWFLHKSINLYGEAFLRKIGLDKNGFGSNEKGIDWIEAFYISKGIDRDALHLYDGSGLSPANRVAPVAMAQALYYAKKQPWFPAFLDALPTYNGMKLKSGTINRVKCYAGYHTSKAGKEYIVSLMINNYNGSTSALVSKMFKLLDELK
jgi:D-alanyl-D-alanine carboxypeptidase/D-alanyl-D-alanine-endopeptidase (penicillin-binding protein 4)